MYRNKRGHNQATDWVEYFLSDTNYKDFKKENITYVTNVINEIKILKKNDHNILCIETYTGREDGNYLTEKKNQLHVNASPPISKGKSIYSEEKGFLYCVYKYTGEKNEKKLTLAKKNHSSVFRGTLDQELQKH